MTFYPKVAYPNKMPSYQSARKRNDKPQTLQQYIINDLDVAPKIDPEEQYWNRVDTLKEFLREKGNEGYVLEISQDPGSVLAGHMAQTAIKELREETDNEDYTFLALILPDNEDKELEREIIEFDINGKQIHPAEPDHNEPAHENDEFEGFVIADEVIHLETSNLTPQQRMVVQRKHTETRDYLLIGSSTSTEHLLGRSTFHGEEKYDILPLTGLSKGQVIQMLHYLKAPQHLFSVAPLDETGLTHRDVERYLRGQKVGDKARKIEIAFLTTEQSRKPKSPFITGFDHHKFLNNSSFTAYM